MFVGCDSTKEALSKMNFERRQGWTGSSEIKENLSHF